MKAFFIGLALYIGATLVMGAGGSSFKSLSTGAMTDISSEMSTIDFTP